MSAMRGRLDVTLRPRHRWLRASIPADLLGTDLTADPAESLREGVPLQRLLDIAVLDSLTTTLRDSLADHLRMALRSLSSDSLGLYWYPHTLVADPGTCEWTMAVDDRLRLALGAFRTTAVAYLLHPEHGGSGVAPGKYVVRRQRERAQSRRVPNRSGRPSQFNRYIAD
jgi:hypothetical protein